MSTVVREVNSANVLAKFDELHQAVGTLSAITHESAITISTAIAGPPPAALVVATRDLTVAVHQLTLLLPAFAALVPAMTALQPALDAIAPALHTIAPTLTAVPTAIRSITKLPAIMTSVRLAGIAGARVNDPVLDEVITPTFCTFRVSVRGNICVFYGDLPQNSVWVPVYFSHNNHRPRSLADGVPFHHLLIEPFPGTTSFSYTFDCPGGGHFGLLQIRSGIGPQVHKVFARFAK